MAPASTAPGTARGCLVIVHPASSPRQRPDDPDEHHGDRQEDEDVHGGQDESSEEERVERHG